MNADAIFLVALQTSLVLGLVHGVNPCGHSWLVLAPFVAGQKSGRRVAMLTGSFIAGTSLGCLAIGLALGLLSAQLPDSIRVVTDMVVGGIIIILGLILVWKPHLLHSHEHCHMPDDDHDHHHGDDPHHHDHDHDHHHDHDHAHHHHAPAKGLGNKASTAWGLGAIGFLNMIVPCPTVAIMYSYALKSGNAARAVSVFASYAVGTALALASVIFLLFRLAGWVRNLEKPWVEPAIMRTVGVMTIAFGVYSMYADFLA